MKPMTSPKHGVAYRAAPAVFSSLGTAAEQSGSEGLGRTAADSAGPVHHENLTTSASHAELVARAVMARPVVPIVEVPKGRYLYVLRAACGVVKIGQTTDPHGRFAALRTSSPLPLDLIALVEIPSPRIERFVHWMLGKFRAHGEWFRFSRPLLSFLAALEDAEWPALVRRLSRVRGTYPGAMAIHALILQHVECFGLPPLPLEVAS